MVRWHSLCIAILLCAFACVDLSHAQSYSIATSQANSGGFSGNSHAALRVMVIVEGVQNNTIQIQGSYGWVWLNNGNLQNYEAYFKWSGNSPSNNSGITANCDGASYVINWRVGTNGPSQQFIVDVPSATATVLWSENNGGFKYITAPPVYMKFNGTELEEPEPPAEERGEVMIQLWNATDTDQKIRWGDLEMTLKPGFNQFRYDGPLVNGVPSIAPDDFQATKYSSGGHNFVMGTLGYHASGEGIEWKEPPLPPSAPSNPAKDKIEILSPGNHLHGPTIAIRHPGGTTTITTLPKTPDPPANGGSNTTGPGAVISDPTAPAPTQTTNNTVTNTVNHNTTNNTTVNNTTVINNNGGTADGENNNGTMNSINPDHEMGEGDEDGRPGDVAGGLEDARETFLNRFQDWKLIAEGSSIPKTTNYTISLPLGKYGAINRSLDFTQQPFPAIRSAILILLTLGLGFNLMKRLSI